jgi:transcriptional regulator GlxA family with amidase domain
MIRRVLLLAPEPVQILDVAGPAEVFARAGSVAGPRGAEGGYSVELVSTVEPHLVASTCGLRYAAGAHYTRVRGRVDTLLVMGGDVRAAARDPKLLRWLARWAPRVRRIGSVCTGAFVLGAAGLLRNRRATTHWRWCDHLAATFPDTKVDSAPIFVKDGPVYTSAGITAGIDMALAMVEEDCGGGVALQIAKDLVLYLRRPGGQSQFSAMLPERSEDRFQTLRGWVLEHLDTPLRVEDLADRAGMSPRHFARVFHAETGHTPARFVERLRVEAACRRLESQGGGLKAIAAATGFGGPDSMRRSFVRRLRITPDQYRAHFQLRERRGRPRAR